MKWTKTTKRFSFSIALILAFKVVLPNHTHDQNKLELSQNSIDSNKIFIPGAITDSSEIMIIENYSKINSISELLDRFKGKPVFIDLWATWCNPCFQEFKFSRRLKDFLNKSQVEIIYVSFDKAANNMIWRNRIQEYELSGNHIMASKILQDSLTTLIWGGTDAYSIPHYLLFDKNKKLISINASPPSSGLKLFKEIGLALK